MGLFAELIESLRKPARGLTFDEVDSPRTPVASALRDRSLFRPQGQALALEQRLMFDGAAASAADQQHGDSTRPPEPATAERSTTTPATARSDAPAATPPAAQTPTLPQHLLVVDSRVDQRELLSAQNTPGVSVLVVDTRTLVNELARLTGADVAASADDTGNASAGGNWTLETYAGSIDQAR